MGVGVMKGANGGEWWCSGLDYTIDYFQYINEILTSSFQ